MRRPRTVAAALDDAESVDAAAFTFVDEDAPPRRLTHAELARASARLGGAIQDRGLARGDRIALILEDNADFVVAFLAALRAGLVPVPIYPPTGLGRLDGYLDNVRHIAARSGARLLITSRMVRPLLGTVLAGAPTLKEIVTIDALTAADAPLAPVTVDPGDLCFLQFTSGSTARPKGVALTHENLVANIDAFMGVALTGADDRGVSWLPLYHDMGLIGFVIAPLLHRRSVTFLPPLLFLKRPARWLEEITRSRATISSAPNFAYALCVKRVREDERAGLDLSSWRVAGCGAEPIRADTLRAFADAFAAQGFDRRALMPCYGLAEATLAVSIARPGAGVRVDLVDGERLWSAGIAAPADDPASPAVAAIVGCGRPIDDHEVAIFAIDDEAGARPLGEREVGEIRARGPSIAAGYHDDPEASAAAFAGGWLRTGDLGYLAGGELHVCGRAKELLIVHGRNYFPQDLEWEASRVEGVRKGNVVAFGRGPIDGERERVIVVFESAAAEDVRGAIAAAIRRQIHGAIGLVVDEVIALDPGALPKTSSGKLQRGRVRELYEAGALDRLTARRGDGAIARARALARSQLGYFRHRVLGRGDDE